MSISSSCFSTNQIKPYLISTLTFFPPLLSLLLHPLPPSLHHHTNQITHKKNPVTKLHYVFKMATVMSSCTAIVPATVPIINNNAMQRPVYVKGFNSYSGLMGHNILSRLGQRVSSPHHFAKVVGSLRKTKLGRRRRGGGLSISCNAASEIFKIAAIMNGLVLVGVAVGFLLLRIEAAIEESE